MINHDLDQDSDDSASEEEYPNNKYHLNIMEERAFWWDNIYGKYIPKIEKCRKCHKQTFSLIEKNSIINPIIFSCNNYKCKSRHSIRYNTFFEKFPKTPISVLSNIIKWFIVDNVNARVIAENLKNKYHLETNTNQNIYTILNLIRRYITHYYRDVYALEKIYDGIRGKFAVDECNFTHDNGSQVWVIRAIETRTRAIRIDIIHGRNASNIEKFIKKYIPPNSTVITDGWMGYMWMNSDNSHYHHIIHSHGAGDFGYGDESTSHIESLWANLKYYIKKMYNMIPNVNFYGFLKESEFRHNISNLNDNAKLDAIFEIFNYVANAADNNPLEISDLINYDY